ncbi:MAG TPA: DnaJ C-terminal domain-containing protein [Dehalococcoidia bacterium]|nr:DnaJ C-terminal domain-containing protein [Dehalococcoidia bacterium]
MVRSFYEILGLTRNSSEKEIRDAYRKLARRYHPDVNPNDQTAESRFKEINGAYEVLVDPEKRQKYDKYGAQWEQADQIEEMQRRRAGRTGFGAAGPGGGDAFGDISSVFDSLFGRDRPAREPAPRRGRDVEVKVELSLGEAFRGTTRTVQTPAGDLCRTCAGSGSVAGAACHACNGSGQTGRPRRLEVTIPAGAKTGSRIRVANEGRSGRGGGPAGDIYLVVTVNDHRGFERRGDNLYVDVSVPLTAAVLGGEVEVSTLGGTVALTIPELTQNGRQFRLARKGMPVMGSSKKRGDLFARVKVQLPDQLDPDERRLFEELRVLFGGDQTAAATEGRD